TTSTMTTTCANTCLMGNPSAVDQGSTGQITFQCSADNPAFTISGGTFSATPYFDGSGFAAPYTTLWIYQSDGTVTTGACSGRSEARQIGFGVTEVDMVAHAYNYCAEYLNVGSSGLPAFAVYWVKAGGLFLFIHSFLAIPTTSTMTTTCANTYLMGNPSAVDQGSTGQITFQCSADNPAFTISGGTF